MRLALFLGGPLDGVWRALDRNESVLRVPVESLDWTLVDEPPDESMTSFQTLTIDYRRAGMWADGPDVAHAECFDVFTVNGVQPPDQAVRRRTWPNQRTEGRCRIYTVAGSTHWGGHAHRHPVVSPDAQTVRFSEMTAEAEAEMAEWDEIISGAKRRR